jgi:hypothetical protein
MLILESSDAVNKKSRVRTPPSESVVGLKSRDLFAQDGVKGRQSMAGCGVAPHSNIQTA